MRRIAACTVIVTYLAVLGFGLISHAVGFKSTDHVGMYFLIWDMYCGWSGYELRHHLVAEGASGQYYELTPVPWGEFTPFGSAPRTSYDNSASFTDAIARHVLEHTEHEEITQIILVEEAWSKKYNLPDTLWSRYYEEPKEPRSYYRTRAVLNSRGEFRERFLDWGGWLAYRSITDNPRLQQKMAGRPFLTTEQFGPSSVRPVSHTVIEHE